MDQKRFVYILRSDTHPDRHYVGLTSDVERRLDWHNSGPSGVTIDHRPWSVIVSLEFTDATTAARFERYLKTGSGRAFAKRHFGGEKASSTAARFHHFVERSSSDKPFSSSRRHRITALVEPMFKCPINIPELARARK